MASAASTAAGNNRLSGVGFIGRSDVVMGKIEVLVARYGLFLGCGEGEGVPPAGEAAARPLRPAFGCGSPRGGVSGFFLSREAGGWTLDLFVRREGRLRRFRSVALGRWGGAVTRDGGDACRSPEPLACG